MSTALDDLREAMVGLLEHTLGDLGDHAALFRSALPRLASATSNPSAESATLPVVDRWLDDALDRAKTAPGPLPSLARCLEAALPEMAWKQAYSDLESTPELEAYRAHYSWVPLAVPGARGEIAPFGGDDLLVGFTLQAPQVLYPHHHHRAPELYGIISGSIDWQLGRSPWSTKHPGDVIVHRSSESHSMRTTDEPSLTWVIWPSDTDSTVFMPSQDPPGRSSEPVDYG